MKNRFELSPRLALTTRWVSGSLILSMLIAGSIYMVQDQQVAQVQLNWPKDEVQIGQSLRLEIAIDELAQEYNTIVDFYLHLPADLEASFLPGSLKILQGSLKEATVLSYSGKNRLLIEDILVDSLRLEVMVQISDDLAFAERSFPLVYGVKVNQKVFPQQKESDHFKVKHSPIAFSHRLISVKGNRNKTARYEILVQNPADGATYNKENGLLSIMSMLNQPKAKIENLRVNGLLKKLPEEQSNSFQIEDLKLQTASTLVIHYEVAFPEGVQSEQNLLSTATAFVPGSVIRYAVPVAIEPPAVDWGSFEVKDSAKSLIFDWATKTETNNKGFWIEKSRDGLSFENVAFVEGQGSTPNRAQYHYRIDSLRAGCYFFRLRQESLSGMSNYSEMTTYTHLDEEAYAINFVEEEQMAQLMLSISQQLRIEIRNNLGVTLAVVFDGIVEASTEYSLDLSMSEFTKGDYLFWMEGEYFKSRRLFVRRLGKWRHFG